MTDLVYKCFNIRSYRGKHTQKPRAEQMNLFDLLCRGVNRISARQGKYTQKPRAEQIYLFCRGATVFLPKANIEEAESNANEFALACFVRRNREASGSRIPPQSLITTGSREDCLSLLRTFLHQSPGGSPLFSLKASEKVETERKPQASARSATFIYGFFTNSSMQ